MDDDGLIVGIPYEYRVTCAKAEQELLKRRIIIIFLSEYNFQITE